MAEMKPCPCCGGRISTIASQLDGAACPCPQEDMQSCGRCDVHCYPPEHLEEHPELSLEVAAHG